MKSSQIIVRTKPIEELRALSRVGQGIRLGKFTLVTAEEIESEIQRRFGIAKKVGGYLHLRMAGF